MQNQSRSPMNAGTGKRPFFPQRKVNFEQLVEKQRDLGFLDRLIAEGDSKYGATMSSMINSQFRDGRSECSFPNSAKASFANLLEAR